MENQLDKIIDKAIEKWPTILALVICVGLTYYAFGCQPTTTSLIDPAKKITGEELAIEFESLIAQHRIRLEDLERQEQIRDILFRQSLILAQGGSVNPAGLVTTLAAIFGVGVTVENVKLRREKKKTNGNSTTA